MTAALVPAGVDAEAFRAAMARLPAPVTVVTCYDSGGAARGLTVSAVVSLSLRPPQLLVCLDTASTTHDALVTAGWFCVNLLAPGLEALALRFAGPAAHRFDGVATIPGRAPGLADAAVRLTCATGARHAGGDHTILLGRVVHIAGDPARTGSGSDTGTGTGLVWHQRAFAHTHRPGTPPAPATHRPRENPCTTC